MIMTVADSLKDTWRAIFRRRGADGAYTRLFDNLDSRHRSALLVECRLRDSELPVIGSIESTRDWLILTTERLAWSAGGQRHELATNIIRDATADLRNLQRGGRSKIEIRELSVLTFDGREYCITLEPGSPLVGTWNVLKNIGARNRHAIERRQSGLAR